MRINHNIAALNTYRQFNNANNAQGKSMEKLSSGLRINSAADDAAGLAISEKMRGQIRGLDKASANAQDGISMIQTAEGALNETHDILQRMRELATQASNDTNVGSDRTEIQKEINQLSSEINRIGNTTEFNTKSLLKGDGQSNLNKTTLVTPGKLAGGQAATTTQATQTTTVSAAAAATDTAKFTLNGIDLTVTFKASGTNGGAVGDSQGYEVDATSANVAIAASSTTGSTATGLRDALTKMIDANDTLKGNFVVSGSGNDVVISAVQGKNFDGASGVIGNSIVSGTIAKTAGTAAVGTNVAAVAATKAIDFSSLDTPGTAAANNTATDTSIKALVGTGMTIAGKQIEFYNSNDGAYTGDAIGVNISTALANSEASDGDKVKELVKNIAQQVGSKIDGVTLSVNASDAKKLDVTASTAGSEGNSLEVSDGGLQKDFQATLQVGANKGQSMTINIADMRSEALGITAKAGTTNFASTNSVTDGTNNTEKEAALDVSNHTSASAAIETINKAIETVSSERSKLGAFQNRLDHTINNLSTSSENLTAAESRIRDVDYALAA